MEALEEFAITFTFMFVNQLSASWPVGRGRLQVQSWSRHLILMVGQWQVVVLELTPVFALSPEERDTVRYFDWYDIVLYPY